ncbi:Protein of unknown function DUF262 [Arenibacter nanhaiticus]|uniref:GmrSD restriction endonucleases N-terminal domain-containing protein n=1 Tax=Arenibacter nanhaiticus TaxID=558155 RepID=A0A1M6KY43_9FLAO|nr:DUF262 domain-containing protein [Arenibacter nanhaiticus]SHJ63829.1 Protein of unknown function DUF262 [Arenibacter nanhaiticus]
MDIQKYNVNQHLIETLLSWIKSGEIAIPEIQRPFVWDGAKVRDLMDSLYQGYPIGYIITWRNPNIRLKDGSTSEGKKILIDGQQRVTALTAAILGDYVINKNYKRVRIKIAFNPIQEKFAVQTPVIVKDKQWIPDISKVLSGQINSFNFTNDFINNNPDLNQDDIVRAINKLFNLAKKQIGLIDLAADLDIETVTEIFIRINSQGVILSQADFVMSKIAANETFGGQELRKAIDYFSHLAVAPEFYQFIAEHDTDFAKTDYFQKMSWLKNESEDLYDPKYTDVLRVAFTTQFNRGKLSDLVSLLSGRNFETRTYEEEIAEASFKKLSNGIHHFINETNFKRFLMIIKSAGFITSKMIRSQNAINFAYIVYLKLKAQGENPANIETYVRRWYVYSVLTGRYSGSPESMFDFDIRQIELKSFKDYLQEKEDGELSQAFWNASLVQSLNTSVTSSPYFHVYLASQVRANDKGFLSKEITVGDLLTYRGDIHHIFPRNYLKKAGLPRGKYNQIANYVYMQQEVNIKVGAKAPSVYFGEILDQCNGSLLKYGGINELDELKINLIQNCIPESIFTMNIDHYDEFLLLRRKLMANKMREYYFSL